MDLNYLLRRHQISLFKAGRAACDRSRRAHRGFADAYAARIAAATAGRMQLCGA